jgi:hypothetical protein
VGEDGTLRIPRGCPQSVRDAHHPRPIDEFFAAVVRQAKLRHYEPAIALR